MITAQGNSPWPLDCQLTDLAAAGVTRTVQGMLQALHAGPSSAAGRVGQARVRGCCECACGSDTTAGRKVLTQISPSLTAMSPSNIRLAFSERLVKLNSYLKLVLQVFHGNLRPCGAMKVRATPLGHRQTKRTKTEKPNLTLPSHISTTLDSVAYTIIAQHIDVYHIS